MPPSRLLVRQSCDIIELVSEDASERWLPIPGYEGFYEVSDHGRARSLSRMSAQGLRRGRIRKAHPLKNGYLQLLLYAYGECKGFYVHQLVAMAFIGPCPEGMEVRHLDGVKTNNAESNLAYGTHLENMADTIRHGTRAAGTRHVASKITDEDLGAIRRQWSLGARGVDLAAQYGISRAAISRIVRGRAYCDGDHPERPPEVCHYPQCDREAEDGFNGGGRRHVYCDDPAHNRLSAKRARERIASQSRHGQAA